jgi:hypothetical protein
VPEQSETALGDGAASEASVLWRFPPGTEDAVTAYAGRFAEPFWADFDIAGDSRTIALPDETTVTETLSHQSEAGYSYTASGLTGISDYLGSFAVTADSVATELAWTTAFHASDPTSLGQALTIIAGAAAAMGAKLAERFPTPD